MAPPLCAALPALALLCCSAGAAAAAPSASHPSAAAQPHAAACALSITDFGAIAGATGSRAAFTNTDAINRTLAQAAGKPGCVVTPPRSRPPKLPLIGP